MPSGMRRVLPHTARFQLHLVAEAWLVFGRPNSRQATVPVELRQLFRRCWSSGWLEMVLTLSFFLPPISVWGDLGSARFGLPVAGELLIGKKAGTKTPEQRFGVFCSGQWHAG